MQWIKNNWLIAIIIVSVLVLFLFDRNNQQNEGVVVEKSKETELMPEMIEVENNEEDDSVWFVDIKGEVEKPGVYQIASDVRVDDVIKLAGGFTEQADPTSINLAQKVFDEMVIIVAKQGQIVSATTETFANGTNNKRIRINYSTKEEIATLNGIGESKAAAIIQYREENGYFKKVEDLLEVSGIGKATLEKIKESIQVP